MENYKEKLANEEKMHLYKTLANIFEDYEECEIKWIENTTLNNVAQVRIYSPVENLPIDDFISSFSSENSLFSFNYMTDVELEHESKEYWYCLCINCISSEYLDIEQIHVVLNALRSAIKQNGKSAEDAIDNLILTGVLKDITNANNP